MKRPLTQAELLRAEELLIDRAMSGLDAAQAGELAALGADDDVSFELAAAAIDIATLRIEELPAGVADKILVAARVARAAVPQTLAGVVPARRIETAGTMAAMQPLTQPPQQPAPQALPAPSAPIPFRRRSRAPLVIAWTVAAAGLAAAASAVLWARGQTPDRVVTLPVTPAPATGRAELLASAPDAATLTWARTGDAAAQAASGDVVWSPARQRGYMRFVGLAPNDPKLSQYQLWIFDKQRDERFPVDGGVFDVTASGEVIVAISAKLPVGEPVLFAVTVEPPGGVVVSKRERIVVTAAPAQSG